MNDNSSKNVLVTGAIQGIGRDIALKFASKGYGVVINYRNPDKDVEAQNLAEECSSISGVHCISLRADVSDSQDCCRLTDETVKQMGSIDVLVNNAGIMKYSLFQRLKDEDYHAIVASNQDSVFYMMKYVSKHMVKRKSGSIVNVSSVSGIYGSPTLAAYAATKAAVIAMTKSAAAEFAYKNVRVNAIAPGMVHTPMTDIFAHEDKENMCKNIPLGRFAEPEEIANAVYWLASDEASYITGHILEISGGLK
jgi:3-oxoacyl-[acyl-carrier protein] reductase